MADIIPFASRSRPMNAPQETVDLPLEDRTEELVAGLVLLRPELIKLESILSEAREELRGKLAGALLVTGSASAGVEVTDIRG